MASKLLLNALKAKIVSNPFASPPGGQQQDDPASAGQIVGDFHLTPAVGADPSSQGGAQSIGQSAPTVDPIPAVSPSILTPAEPLNLKALVLPADTSVANPVGSEQQPALAVPAGVLTPQTRETVPQLSAGAGGPVLASVPVSDAVVFPQLTLETDKEAEDLAVKVKLLEGQKRKLTFKRFMPRAAGFAVLVLMGLSASAFSGQPPMPGATIRTSVFGSPDPSNLGSSSGGSESITAMRYFIEVARVCRMEPPVRSKLQQQLREETNGLTVNEAIAYWVFACGYPIEAYVDRGFGPWATEHGVVPKDDDVSQLLTRSVMQKIFAVKVL